MCLKNVTISVTIFSPVNGIVSLRALVHKKGDFREHSQTLLMWHPVISNEVGVANRFPQGRYPGRSVQTAPTGTHLRSLWQGRAKRARRHRSAYQGRRETDPSSSPLPP